MHLRRWALALPLVLAASITSTHAATVRDNAGMFSADAVRQAQNRLDKLEREYNVPVTIETINSLEGRNIDSVLPERAKQNRAKGLYVLIAKQETKIEVESSREYAKALTKARNQEVRGAFIQEFKKRDFNAGLNRGIEAIETVLAAAQAESGGVIRAAAPPAARGGAAPRARPGLPAVPGAGGGGGGFGLWSLLGIGLLVLAVLFGIRLLGSLFGGGNRGYAGPQRMGGGPGYGAPGYGGGMGGGGGGFMSSMFGGIGGALAGNWLYDQFSGRSHGSSVDQGSMGAGAGGVGDAGTEWGGGDGGADWGGDAGGGGDVGGGGDWGGGGGGGDWSGGGGGGDWGGGDGGGGGDW